MTTNNSEVPIRDPFTVTWWMVLIGLFVVGSLLAAEIVLWLMISWQLAFVITLLLLGSVILVAMLLKKFLVVVGGGQRPRVALIVRWGRVIAACNQGLFLVFFPPEKLVKMRTTQYRVDYEIDDAWTKADEKTGEQVQKVSVGVTLAFTLPQPGVLYKSGHGADLLRKFYYAFPFNTENFKVLGELGPHLSGAVTEAVIHSVAQFTHTELATKTKEIEEAVKMYLLKEEGNLYAGLGIPEENTDFGITSIVINDDVEKSMRGAEIMFRDARANQDKEKIEATTARETADDRAEATEKLLKVYQEAHLPAHAITMLLRGTTGEELSIADLRDISIIQREAGIGDEDIAKIVAAVAGARGG